MADHMEHSESKEEKESLMEKITEKFHHDDDSSSLSDSDSEKKTEKKTASSSTVKDKIFRLFGREKPVHQVFGGGKGKITRRITLLQYWSERRPLSIWQRTLKYPAISIV